MAKLGQRVYIDELQQIGEVVAVIHGEAVAARIKTIDEKGNVQDQIVQLADKTFTLLNLVWQIWRLIKKIIGK